MKHFCIIFSLILSAVSFTSPIHDEVYVDLQHYRTNDLKPISIETFEQLKALDPEIFKPGVQLRDVREMTITDFRSLLEYGIKHRIGSMNYFAHPHFHNSREIQYWSKEVLNVGNSEYSVASLFPPYGRTVKDFNDQGLIIPKNTFYMYEGVLVGNGRLVVIYPHHIRAKIVDPPYNFLTGRHELFRVNILDNISEYNGITGFSHIRGRDRATDHFQSIIGPLNVPVAEIKMLNWRGRSLKVSTSIVTLTFEHPAFYKYNIPYYNRPENITSIPIEVAAQSRQLAKSETGVIDAFAK